MGLACPLTVMWLEQCEQKGRGRRRLQPPLGGTGTRPHSWRAERWEWTAWEGPVKWTLALTAPLLPLPQVGA